MDSACAELLPAQNTVLVHLFSAPRNLELKLQDPDLLSSSLRHLSRISEWTTNQLYPPLTLLLWPTASMLCAEVTSTPSQTVPMREGLCILQRKGFTQTWLNEWVREAHSDLWIPCPQHSRLLVQMRFSWWATLPCWAELLRTLHPNYTRMIHLLTHWTMGRPRYLTHVYDART